VYRWAGSESVSAMLHVDAARRSAALACMRASATLQQCHGMQANKNSAAAPVVDFFLFASVPTML
jgi:hypothetical protein